MKQPLKCFGLGAFGGLVYNGLTNHLSNVGCVKCNDLKNIIDTIDSDENGKLSPSELEAWVVEVLWKIYYP